MVKTEKLMMSMLRCIRLSGLSLQMLADVTIPSLFGHPLTPRSANLFKTSTLPHLVYPHLPKLKHVKPRCLPSPPDPFRDSAAAVAAASARPRSSVFNEALHCGVSKGKRSLGLPGRGGCDASPRSKGGVLANPIHFRVTSGAVIRGLILWHAEMNLGGETITQPTRDMRFPAQGCSIYFQTSPLLG